VVAALILSAAILFIGRWQITISPSRIYELDRWTGTVNSCDLPAEREATPGGRRTYFYFNSIYPACDNP
jgi:hypothetical protein